MEIDSIEFVRELDGSYLLLTAGETESFAERMLLGGRPPHILPFRIWPESPRRYCFEISGRESLAAVCRLRALEAREIRELVRAVFLSCGELEKYLLKPGNLILEPGLMYRGRDGWAFCCYPDQEEDVMEQLQRLSRFFLRKCNHEDPAAASLAYDLFQLCHEENVSFAQVMELVGPGEGAAEAGGAKGKKRGLFARTRRNPPDRKSER